MNAAKRGKTVFEIFMNIVALVMIYPTFYVLINAFKPGAEIASNPVGLPSHWTLDNFATVLGTTGAGGFTFLSSMMFTALLCLGSVVGIVLFASMAAYMLVRDKSRTSRRLFYFFAFFIVIPFQVIMVPLVALATDLNIKDPIGLIVMYWGLGIPSGVFMFHGFIKTVPESLDESAAMDGAGAFVTFFRIIFPLMMPIVTTIVILNTLWVWNDFLLPYITLRKGTLVLFQFNFFRSFSQDNGALTASLVMTATPVIVLFLSLQKFIIKGVSAGAVKG